MTVTRLADALRPKRFEDIVGQDHLFGERGVIRRLMAAGKIPNMIFFGPPGTGKTTAAEIVARESDMVFHRLNATTATLSDVKDILTSTNNLFSAGGILLYIDEIQYFNKKQQQALLEYIEDGRVTLITSTTENPHFYIHNAIISRSSLFEFKPVAPAACAVALRRAVDYLNERENRNIKASDEVLTAIARSTSGDVRHAMGVLENAYYMAEEELTQDILDQLHVGVGNFDEDTHYDLLSCLQKSIRGSDPDAAVFYLAKLLSFGELISVCRRLQVIASEDIGLAYPMAAAVVRACCESAKELGMPEAQIPLAHAAVLLATSPKSNSAYEAINEANKAIEAGEGRNVPTHLQSPLFRGYKYPHDYPGHYVKQQYLPNDLKGRTFYRYGDNKMEEAARQYAEKIKKG